MPYVIRKIKNKPLYKVYNRETGEIYSKGTTEVKAKAQVRLLEGLEKGIVKKKSY